MMRPEGRAGSRAGLLNRARRLARALPVVALCRAAGASEPAALLKSVILVAYRSRTMPPPFGSATLDGRPLALTDLRGWVVILSLWASWCPECRAEMPPLERLLCAYAARGLALVGVNTREDASAVRRHARS